MTKLKSSQWRFIICFTVFMGIILSLKAMLSNEVWRADYQFSIEHFIFPISATAILFIVTYLEALWKAKKDQSKESSKS